MDLDLPILDFDDTPLKDDSQEPFTFRKFIRVLVNNSTGDNEVEKAMLYGLALGSMKGKDFSPSEEQKKLICKLVGRPPFTPVVMGRVYEWLGEKLP